MDRLTSRLLATIDTPYDVRVRVTNVEKINAFAMLGGDIVLFKGLIFDAKSAEEVAGVLAHEIGHLAQRHPTQAIVRSIGLTALFEIFSGGGTGASSLVQTRATLSYGRDAEREADDLAQQILKDANISTAGLVSFF